MAPGNTLEHEVALGNTRGTRRYDRNPHVIAHIHRNLIYSVYLSSSNLASIVGNTSYRRCKNLISKISSHYFLSGTYLILPRTRFIPPRDLKDAYDNWPKWKAIFIRQKGLLLLLIGLKFPCCRKLFIAGYKKHHMVYEPEKRVFLALADTARKFEEDRAYAQLREDIDCIKGPLKVNGLCMYLRRLHITKPSTVGIRLGAGKQRFVVSKYSMQAKKRLAAS